MDGLSGDCVFSNAGAVTDVDLLHTRILALAPGFAVPWFLDVDGVLNIETGVPHGPQAWPSYRRVMVATSRDPAVPFTWSPDLIDCLNLLITRGQVQVHWLTSWDSDAPLCAAPAIGLMAGQIGARETSAGLTGHEGWWKLQVVRSCQGGPVIWTDDYIDEASQAEPASWPLDATVFSVSPDSAIGLLPGHLDLIITAIADWRADALVTAPHRSG